MSTADAEAAVLTRLEELFANGTIEISAAKLFDGMQIDDRQKHSVCESLKARGLINTTYELGQRLPYLIEILPIVKAESDNLVQATAAENSQRIIENPHPLFRSFELSLETFFRIVQLWFGDPNTRFARYFGFVGVTMIFASWWHPILQQFATNYLGISEDVETGKHVFWSGWGFVVIAIFLYVWTKRQSALEKNPNDVNSGDPIEIEGELHFSGSDSVLTSNTPSNPLLSEEVVAIYPTTIIGVLSRTEDYDGLIGSAAVRRKSANYPASICRYVVEVTKFSHIPYVEKIGSTRGAADAIEAVFLLSDKSGSQFPWCFEAKEVILKTFRGCSSQKNKLETPYNLSTDDLVALRYFINAVDAGIYHIKCVVYVSARGLEQPIRVPLHGDPIPIAFYGKDDSESDTGADLIEFPKFI